jgi:ribonuclease Z
MDHVCGFDTFFRHNYNRPDVPVQVWGPPGTIECLEHRFRSFTWNLHEDQPGEWIVREVAENEISAARFYAREAFEEAHLLPVTRPEGDRVFESHHWRLETMLLPHGSIPSAAWRLVEADRSNVDERVLRDGGFEPGPWLQKLTDPGLCDDQLVDTGRESADLGSLRERLLTTTPGSSLAYLTDFRVDPGSDEWNRLVEWLSGTNTIVCESQYLARDEALAKQHGHMTSDLVGRLAEESGAGSLVLHHLSRRYRPEEWREMREEAASRFPSTEFCESWNNLDG